MSTVATIPQPATAPGWGLVLTPGSLAEAQEFARLLSESDFVPKSLKGRPGDIMVVGAMGARLGLDIFTAMSGIASINGRPAVWGDLLLALCMRSPSWGDMTEEAQGEWPADTYTAVCTVTRKGQGPKVGMFSVGEAKKAQLWTKAGPWSQYPQRMLKMRARALALRDAFPDAIAGLSSAEEMSDSDLREVEATVRPATPEPVRQRRAKAPAAETASYVPSTAPQQAEEKPAQVSAPAPQLVPEQAPDPDAAALASLVNAARVLWRSLESAQRGCGEAIINRVAALHDAKAIKDIIGHNEIETARLDLAALEKALADGGIGRVEEELARWEAIEGESK